MATSWAAATSEVEVAPWRIQTQDQQWQIGPDVRSITVRNPGGDIRVRRGEAGQIRLHAVTQMQAGQAGPGWQVKQRRHTWSLHVPAGKSSTARTRVDLVLLVPADLILDLRTRQGRIDVHQQQAEVRTRNESGRTTVTSTVALNLRSTDGPIIAALLNPAPRAANRLQSRSGAIDLAVSESADLSIRVRACAGIDGLPVSDASRCPSQILRGHGPGSVSVRTRSRFSLTRVPATQ